MFEHLADVESDLSAFHRVDDVRALHPQRLIDLAVRLGFYPGVIQSRWRAEAASAGSPSFTGNDTDRVIDSDATALAIDPVLGELIDFG